MAKEKFGTRLAHAWDAFMNKDPTPYTSSSGGIISSYRPDIRYVRGGNERSVVTAVYDRIATDVSMLSYHHAEIDENGAFKKIIKSKLDTCLSLSANLDQTGRDLIKDSVVSLFDEGAIAIVPTLATINPKDTDAWMPIELRTGKIVNWYPYEVDVEIYNPYTGMFQQMRFEKKKIAIIQNPYYRIMNANGSVAKRLMAKLSLGDVFDERIASDKMNLIVQLPYAVSSGLKTAEAKARVNNLTAQMQSNPYGIAYIGVNEKITQLNRAIDNGIRDNIKDLKEMLYSQLGITQEIMDGTADEQTMINYYSRTIGPVAKAIRDEFSRKFISQTARTQNQDIVYYRNPFELTPVSKIADIADKFTRNEILSPNELRGIVGYKPSDDPSANELRNRNINQARSAQPSLDGAPPEGTYPEMPNEAETPSDTLSVPIDSV